LDEVAVRRRGRTSAPKAYFFDAVQVSETFFTLETVNDCDESAAPVDWPLLEVPAVGEVAPAEDELLPALLDAEAELSEAEEPDGDALAEPDAAPDCVP